MPAPSHHVSCKMRDREFPGCNSWRRRFGTLTTPLKTFNQVLFLAPLINSSFTTLVFLVFEPFQDLRESPFLSHWHLLHRDLAFHISAQLNQVPLSHSLATFQILCQQLSVFYAPLFFFIIIILGGIFCLLSFRWEGESRINYMFHSPYILQFFSFTLQSCFKKETDSLNSFQNDSNDFSICACMRGSNIVFHTSLHYIQC